MRALVLSGGGANGSWQEGGLRYLIEEEALARIAPTVACESLDNYLKDVPGELQPYKRLESVLHELREHIGGDAADALYKPYDIICGVSVGALNGSMLAQQLSDDHYSAFMAYRYLSKIWDGVCPEVIRKDWFFGKLAPFLPWGQLKRNALYDSRPLGQLIRDNLDKAKLQASGVELRIGAVSRNSRMYRGFTQDDASIVDAVIASSAYPIFFLPVEIEGELWTDGGEKNIVPLGDAIAAGATEIDVIVCQPLEPTPWEGEPTLLNLLSNTLGNMTEEIVRNDLKWCQHYNDLIDQGVDLPGKMPIKLRVFAPPKGLGSGLNFDAQRVAKLRQRGYDEIKALALGTAEHTA